ncbi:MAG: multidrug ABC transporter substrate-binding protein, partial [Acidobacteria bacterium]|nr:multidrug ABC transporter substrate-binding protein [Acidobacteriota bacterium]
PHPPPRTGPVPSLAALSALFATGAALLVAVGLYGVLARSVASRTREFGLRLALGADTTAVLRMVLAPVARVLLAGSTFGGLAAWGVGRAARAVLYEVEGLPPVVIVAAAAGLAAVASVAAFVPALRASRVDPRTALRHP